MKHILAVFPAGSVGVALLFLRASVCLHVVLFTSNLQSHSPVLRLCLLVPALCIALGLFARAAVLLAAIAFSALAVNGIAAAGADTAIHVCDAVAVALAGPGAFSIDAILFGRRVIDLGR